MTPYFHLRHRQPPSWNDLPRTAWVRLNRLRTGVGRFHSCLYKWDVASSTAWWVWHRGTSRRTGSNDEEDRQVKTKWFQTCSGDNTCSKLVHVLPVQKRLCFVRLMCYWLLRLASVAHEVLGHTALAEKLLLRDKTFFSGKPKRKISLTEKLLIQQNPHRNVLQMLNRKPYSDVELESLLCAKALIYIHC